MADFGSDLYDTLMAPLERAGLRRLREGLLANVRGRVLELGVWTGLNLPLYREATQVVGIDLEGGLAVRSRRTRVPVALVRGRAEELPFADDSFDAVIGTLVFCMVADPDRGLVEARRVLRPGGRLLLLEHVRAPQPLVAQMQDAVAPVWTAILSGCHPNRDTLASVRRAGLVVHEARPHLGGILLQIKASKDL